MFLFKTSTKKYLGWVCPPVLWTAEAWGHCSVTFLSRGGHSTVLQPPSQGWWCFSAGHGQRKKNANLNYVLTLVNSRELRCLFWCKWQVKRTCSHMELRCVMDRDCSFPGWAGKCCSALGVCLPQMMPQCALSDAEETSLP